MQKSVSFKNNAGLNLKGLLTEADTDKIIIMCHGFASDKNSKGRFEKLSAEFCNSAISSLAFDFRGCGQSDDAPITVEGEINDLFSAIDFVKKLGYSKIGLYGHSSGSRICLSAYSQQISTIVVSGALTAPMFYDWNLYYTPEQLAAMNKYGSFRHDINTPLRKSVVISKEYIDSFAAVDSEKLLGRINCPVLIIHGNRGEEEQALLANSVKAVKFLSPDSSLKIIEGADHSFLTKFNQLTDYAVDWFNKYLK